MASVVKNHKGGKKILNDGLMGEGGVSFMQSKVEDGRRRDVEVEVGKIEGDWR